MDKTAAFGINENVRLSLSGEKGTVIGIATYARGPDQFYVEYLAGDGRQTEAWFHAESLRRA